MQKEIEKNIAGRLGVTLKESDKILRETLGAIMEESKKDPDGNLRIYGFGSFKVVEKPARKGVFKGVEWSKAAYKTIKFKPYKAFLNIISTFALLLVTTVLLSAQVETEPVETITPNLIEWVKSNYIILIGIGMSLFEAIVRLTPTEKDNNLFRTIQSWIDVLLPNYKKGGGTFAAFDDKKDAPIQSLVMGEPKPSCKNKNCINAK